jgi:hypothetical protein
MQLIPLSKVAKIRVASSLFKPRRGKVGAIYHRAADALKSDNIRARAASTSNISSGQFLLLEGRAMADQEAAFWHALG